MIHRDLDGVPVETHPDNETCHHCFCAACGALISDRRRRRPTWVTVCRSCADLGLYARTPAVVHGQHKGVDLVSRPDTINSTTTYDRG